MIVGGGRTGRVCSFPEHVSFEALISTLLHQGVELMAELSDLAKNELNHFYPRIARLLCISIYDATLHILGVYSTSQLILNGPFCIPQKWPKLAFNSQQFTNIPVK